MNAPFRRTWHALFVLALAAAGCGETTGEPTSAGSPAPSASAPAASAPAPAPAPTPTPEPAPVAEQVTKDGAVAWAVKLEKVTFDEFSKRVANKDAKYTLVDVWATWCEPCKKNFPHVVQMHEKYGPRGLAVVSLSFDDPNEAKQVHDAQEFLAEKKAVMTNLLLDGKEGEGNEKLNINSIPAVFLFGPDGKEVKRFTGDDPNNQFTYDEVEEAVVALLDGKPLPGPKANDQGKAGETEKAQTGEKK